MSRTTSFIKASRTSIVAATLAIALAGCGSPFAAADTSDQVAIQEASTSTAASTTYDSAESSDESGLFTERDLAQTAETDGAATITLADGQDVQIDSEGTYIISGTASDVTISVDVEDSEKVQLVLDGVSITNQDSPAIYVKSADKVFVTTAESSTNTLQVTGAFVADGETNTDAVIFAKDDLVLNGLGTLVINSTDNGISAKDDLKVTGGSYQITAASDAIEANDSICIADGSFAIVSSKDGLHAENDEDQSQGSIYISGGNFDIQATSDGIQATTTLQIDGGGLTIDAAEALEATYVQINDGVFDLSASDDGINATYKSTSAGTPAIEITGGTLSISMAAGDTDALDTNGDLIVSGGTIDISAQSAFDFDGTASYTGGTITVNGEQVSEITNSMMGGGRMGPMGGQQGDRGPMGDQQGDASSMSGELLS